MPKRLLQNTFDAKKDNRTYSDEGKSKGELDDYPVRRYLATSEGTIEKVPVNDSDITNKKYVNDQIAAQTHESTTVSDTSTINLTLTGVNITGVTIDSAIDHDALLNFVANEHIDWTSTTSNFSTTGTVDGGDAEFTNLGVGKAPGSRKFDMESTVAGSAYSGVGNNLGTFRMKNQNDDEVINSFNMITIVTSSNAGNHNAQLRLGVIQPVVGQHGSTFVAQLRADDGGRDEFIRATTDGTNTKIGINSKGVNPTETLDVNGKSIFKGDIEIQDARTISVGTTAGTKIATATTQKLGFWNKIPVIQQTVASDTLANLYTALRASGLIG